MLISEVSKEFNISVDTLRYYEKIGLIPPVNRTFSGIRDYKEDDCKWVEFIKCMRGAGLSIEALTEYVSLFQQGNDTIKERKQLLINQRNTLAEKIKSMQTVLERLDAKIDGYEERVLIKENDLVVK